MDRRTSRTLARRAAALLVAPVLVAAALAATPATAQASVPRAERWNELVAPRDGLSDAALDAARLTLVDPDGARSDVAFDAPFDAARCPIGTVVVVDCDDHAPRAFLVDDLILAEHPVPVALRPTFTLEIGASPYSPSPVPAFDLDLSTRGRRRDSPIEPELADRIAASSATAELLDAATGEERARELVGSLRALHRRGSFRPLDEVPDQTESHLFGARHVESLPVRIEGLPLCRSVMLEVEDRGFDYRDRTLGFETQSRTNAFEYPTVGWVEPGAAGATDRIDLWCLVRGRVDLEPPDGAQLERIAFYDVEQGRRARFAPRPSRTQKGLVYRGLLPADYVMDLEWTDAAGTERRTLASIDVAAGDRRTLDDLGPEDARSVAVAWSVEGDAAPSAFVLRLERLADDSAMVLLDERVPNDGRAIDLAGFAEGRYRLSFASAVDEDGDDASRTFVDPAPIEFEVSSAPIELAFELRPAVRDTATKPRGR
ncbi:MAG: hypothetical protein R3F34_18725 [Planctomycetota bacterium]